MKKLNDYVKLNMDFIKNWGGIQSENSDIKQIAIDLPFSQTDTYFNERCQRINGNIMSKIYDEIDKEFDNKNGEYFEFHFDENKRILTVTDLKFYDGDNEEEEEEENE